MPGGHLSGYVNMSGITGKENSGWIPDSYWIDVKSKEDEHSSYHTHGTNYINRITDIADITSMHTRLKFHRSSFNSLPPSTMFIARTLASSTYKIHSTLNA